MKKGVLFLLTLVLSIALPMSAMAAIVIDGDQKLDSDGEWKDSFYYSKSDGNEGRFHINDYTKTGLTVKIVDPNGNTISSYNTKSGFEKTVYFTPNKEGKYTVKVTHNNGIGSKIFGIRVRIY
ncbi:hypothetical protein ABNB59_13965 [Paenibacillus larvae]|jgi:hypothetical protein|uniref:Uncharacterized protein n=4 Tax=Paenibacillus larvae TaxID=1464 RepID=V9W7L4_9BACL|nr:hypothetical protein [Paenibacillus larvae]AHD05690.1 hypothetical protein ERIC2_c18910 [Paenibacillus larvae subsp. larvae DSM 25430]AQR76830.1 hypothetical protein BXP28_05015 [Paenibacillus larvae subsp. larvae]AQT83427.1 hypothetical protein B1222_01605 [Paenibacillus larvae subsp. pulvifaciens]AQZ48528.1 hypothetical protein B5S25_20060 [Paenibacillus larvae subsp. pulvifaciens]ARF70255.1 hypothetical protein B7C51_24055 [Paenibacillus larvae subsp. pulvifaciens]